MTVATTLEKVFRDERPRLYRWMLSLTQQHHFAEDIVQETYITAWQNQHKITDITGIDKWLNAIAYNIYRRWQRQQGTHVSREMPLTDAPQDMLAEYQLDHDELSDLLDNALAMLSPKSRAILIARYLEEQPQAKVARDLGMTESAVAVRLHRGKLTLRKLIENDLRNYPGDEAWQDTRLWCGSCGKAKYRVRMDAEAGEMALLCPHCCPDERYPSWESRGSNARLQGIKTVKPALNRLRQDCYEFYSRHIDTLSQRCPTCGAMAKMHLTMPDFLRTPDWYLGMHSRCPNCNVISYTSLSGVTISLPQATTFDNAGLLCRKLSPTTLGNGRAHVRTPVTRSNQVCRSRQEKQAGGGGG
ncbi:MAG: sigma-70 family RNA polymerase sigma factor, partial [Chloroflexota bacterium]